jgi:hypothetical protein
MAEFSLEEVTITYSGEERAVAGFQKAMHEGTRSGVDQVIDYMERNHLVHDYEKHEFRIEGADDLENPDDFEALVHEFTDITFAFNLYYRGTAGGCWGNGRYFCVFEKGKKVYDANCWSEEMCFLNDWARSIGLRGVEFYGMDAGEAQWTIAKGRLIEQGKAASAISDDDIQAYLDNTGVTWDGSIYDEEFLLRGHDYSYWSRILDDDGGYEHYLERKEEGELPCLTAEARWGDLLEIADKGPPESLAFLTKKWAELGLDRGKQCAALPEGEWWEDKEQCLALYEQDYGKHTEAIREYIGYCFPKEFWLDQVYFEKAAKVAGKLYLAEAYTHDDGFMENLKQLIAARSKTRAKK